MNLWQCPLVAGLSACMALPPVSATALPATNQAAPSVIAAADKASPLIEVRHGRKWRRHARHHWRHWGHRHYYDYDGGALAAGAILGLAAGAIAANAAAGNSAVAYCSRRYRSYDPASSTYLGYDGYRHPCP
jgi:hypothetical protein